MTNTKDNRSYQSGNNKYKSKKNNKTTGKVVLVIFLLMAVGLYFLKPLIEKNIFKGNGSFIIEEIIYDLPEEEREKDGISFIVSGQKIEFSFVTDRLDTIRGKDFDRIAQIINLKITNYNRDYKYKLDDGIIYPCGNEIILSWGVEIQNYDSDFDSFEFKYKGNLASIGSGNIIDKALMIPNEKFLNFVKHKNADCATIINITEVTPPDSKNDCNFYVFTDHPNNLKNDSILLADSASLTYFNYGEREFVEISISGKEGPFLKQNEFKYDTTMKILNVWARTNKSDAPVFFMNNGKFIEECIKVIEGCTNPKAPNYNPNATIDNGTCQDENIFTSDNKDSTVAEVTTVTKKYDIPKTFKCSNCGIEMPIKNRLLGNENISIGCKKDIITELVQQSLKDKNTDRLEEFWKYGSNGTKCLFNGSDVSSSWWGIFRADNLKLKSISIKKNGKINKLEIYN